MSGSLRSTTQQSNGPFMQHRQCFGARADRGHFDVVVKQQLDDALTLDIVVLDHQQPFLVRHDIRS